VAIERKVNAKFGATGNIIKRFGIMARAASRFGRKTTDAFKRINRGANRFKGITSGFLKAQVIGKGFALLTQGIGSVVDQFIQFDKAALGATVRFKDIGPNAANFNEKLKEIEKSAREVGATTEFTSAQAAEGLNKLAVSGFTSAEAMGALKGIIDVSTATGEDFARVADIQSDLLGAFGLAAGTTAEKIKNLNRLNDVMVKTANSANVTLETMFETMKQVGPIATGVLGASLEEVAALTGVLGNSGIKGSEAMTALKNAYLRLAAPQSAARKTLDFFNVSLDNGRGGVRKITDVIGELGVKIKDLDPTKQAEIMDQIFGKRAIAGAKNIMDNVASIKELEKSLLNAGFTAQRTAEIMRTSIDAKLKSLGSAATEAGFKILNAFRVDGKSGIDALTESIRSADMQPFIEGLKVLGSIAVGIGEAFFFVGDNIGFAFAKMAQFKDFILDVLPKSKFGADFDPESTGSTPARSAAPNAAEAQARAQAQSVNVGGTINVNAPAGTTAESDGPVGFNLNNLGLNGA
jgi:TP901 family phage tail tape measure protein